MIFCLVFGLFLVVFRRLFGGFFVILGIFMSVCVGDFWWRFLFIFCGDCW